ncbi:MAG: thermonuclease family protein [Methylacidiphilales bacterium]|nr:thermonuclease family protein [Candidatus Methylacidiphilales bacterium]
MSFYYTNPEISVTIFLPTPTSSSYVSKEVEIITPELNNQQENTPVISSSSPTVYLEAKSHNAVLDKPMNISNYPCLQGLNWEIAYLIDVIDGDTINVRLTNGHTERVRYIGIDAPESYSPYYYQANLANQSFLPSGSTLYMARDISDRDQYGRLLRYVVSEHGSLSHELVRGGWAETLTINPDLRCADELNSLQFEAREFKRGLWAFGEWNIKVTDTPVLYSTPESIHRDIAPLPQDQEACHPSYPDVCIPAPPPDLDCNEIPYRRFTVYPPDPHNFDRDNDGIGCER